MKRNMAAAVAFASSHWPQSSSSGAASSLSSPSAPSSSSSQSSSLSSQSSSSASVSHGNSAPGNGFMGAPSLPGSVVGGSAVLSSPVSVLKLPLMTTTTAATAATTPQQAQQQQQQPQQSLAAAAAALWPKPAPAVRHARRGILAYVRNGTRF